MRSALKHAEKTAHHPLPFPCVVYTKKNKPGHHNEYEFSHYCSSSVLKKIPRSLRVRDLHEHAHTNPSWLQTLQKTCFMVLVAGDVGQCVCSSNTREKRNRFLYRGSGYTLPNSSKSHNGRGFSEFNDDYIPLHFYSTLAMFSEGVLCSVADLECGLALFPRIIRDSDIETLGRWVDHNLVKSVHGSVWVTHQSDSYNEHTKTIQRKPIERLFPSLQPHTTLFKEKRVKDNAVETDSSALESQKETHLNR